MLSVIFKTPYDVTRANVFSCCYHLLRSQLLTKEERACLESHGQPMKTIAKRVAIPNPAHGDRQECCSDRTSRSDRRKTPQSVSTSSQEPASRAFLSGSSHAILFCEGPPRNGNPVELLAPQLCMAHNACVRGVYPFSEIPRGGRRAGGVRNIQMPQAAAPRPANRSISIGSAVFSLCRGTRRRASWRWCRASLS